MARMERQFSTLLLLILVGSCCCQEDVRVVGGNGPNEGRVEVLISGEWGTVCDDLWDISDGHVICKQLGYSGAEAVRYFAYFGEGSGSIWLDNVQCMGDEESIADCRKNEIGDHNCQHYEDAGVECNIREEESATEAEIEDVRVVGGSSVNVGRVEVLVKGRWGTVCDDSWDINDGIVVCRQLGYPGADSVEGYAFFGEGSDPIWLDEVRCSGEENNLNDCPRNDFGDHNCNHYEDAGVRCTRTETVTDEDVLDTPLIEDIRLVGGSTKNEGRVEVYVNGEWGTVCDDLWDQANSDVVCRQLGYQNASYFYTAAFFGKGEGRIWLDNVECTGSEESIQDCQKNEIGEENCAHSEDVSVVCISFEESEGHTTPVASTQRWRDDFRCGDSYLAPNGEVAECNPIGTNPCCSQFNWCDMTSRHCDCFHCSDYRRIVIRIVRLVGGNSENEGRVEVYANSAWGTICGDTWNQENSEVVCRQLGYPGVSAFHTSAFFGQGEGRIWLDYVDCTGSEETLEACEKNKPREVNCAHSKDVSVVCKPLEASTTPGTSAQRWRDDTRCGDGHLAPNGQVSECDPDGATPCCSQFGWCGSTSSHCDCFACIDYRRVVIKLLRLVGGNSENEGRVEVYVNGEWWTICGDTWNQANSEVVCRQLGYPGVSVFHTSAFFGQGQGRIWLDYVYCTGSEETLEACGKNKPREVNCPHSKDVSVVCKPLEVNTIPAATPPIIQDIRLTGGSRVNVGRVEILVNGVWGAVCDDQWDISDATVICKQLGFPGAEAIRQGSYFGPGPDTIWVDNVDCVGEETDFSDCPKNDLGEANCQGSNHAGVICHPMVTHEEIDDYLLFSEVMSIHMIPLQEHREGPIPPLTGMVYAISIAPAFSEAGFFFSDVSVAGGTIFYHSLRENNTEMIAEGVGSAEGLAYNHVTREIFWTSHTNSSISRKKVFPHTTDGEEMIVKMSASDRLRGIALDICNSAIFWTNWNEDSPSIMTSTMTGTDPQAIITKDIILPNGIKIDAFASKLYWCDAGLDKIERANLDGTNRVVVVDSSLDHPFDLAIHGNSLYFTDWTTREVIKVNKYTGGNFTVLRSLDQYPMGITILERPLPCSALPCNSANGGCHDICGTDVHGVVQCSCLQGKYLASDHKTCLPATSSTAELPTTVGTTSSTKGTPVIEDIRLVNGYSHNNGRVEVYVNGEWGTVCHDRWEIEDAEVVCRWLGYTGADAALGNAVFGEGTGQIWLDNVRCSGDEETLRECRMRPIGEHNCDHNEDAGVECTIVPTPFGPRPGNDYRDDLRCRGGFHAPNFGQARCNRNGAYPCCSPEFWCGNTPEHCNCEGCVDYRDASVKDIRLRGPYPNAGKVDVFIFGEWGSVCNDNWDMADANVACRMLGYPGADEIKRGDYYGEGYDPVLMDDVHCNGDEESLSDCPRNEPGYHDCDHRYEAASVVCTPPPSTTLPAPSTEDTSQEYRHDFRCGGDYVAPNGEVAKCNKDGQYPCCSSDKWCGNTSDHCDCKECIDYRYHD